mmetsp:Transcript_40948/g.80740  ORF Transcript_40948/g.80740 Transcript_40948/m.80740 type:complete len:249 (+) Transcript_40948:1495-2241(+)
MCLNQKIAICQSFCLLHLRPVFRRNHRDRLVQRKAGRVGMHWRLCTCLVSPIAPASVCHLLQGHERLGLLDHLSRPAEEAHAVVQVCWFHRQNSCETVGRLSSGLFTDERKRVALEDHADRGFGILEGWGVDVDASFQKVSVEVGDHAADVSTRHGFALAMGDVFNDTLWELAAFPSVHRVDRPVFRKLHIRVGEIKGAERWIESESEDSPPEGDYDHGGRTVNDVPGHQLFASRLKKVLLLHRSSGL